MQIHVKGHQVEVTPAIRDYALGKFERLGRTFEQVNEMTIVISVEKLLHKAEVTLLSGGRTLHAETTAADMYAALDALVDKLGAQMRKLKGKRADHHADEVRSARYA
ncbi:ribosome hibernation-promoting factor, HPF/YfiA family [Dokdonella koreensis]|uniref:Ribosome hibernation promoting factor n=1 Tax=Dokdonella koreensis DS-123 TaxID=1300342 RepID=A0A160DTK2_9GAMM|nr:ribosome-associated translation inhibitor RaiA [Dokdonella koreensis]ANB17708.1 Ribosomal subunit interface protein [Dokdonella koreensis DS-123]